MPADAHAECKAWALSQGSRLAASTKPTTRVPERQAFM
jgi:hypothetical protein